MIQDRNCSKRTKVVYMFFMKLRQTTLFLSVYMLNQRIRHFNILGGVKKHMFLSVFMTFFTQSLDKVRV